VITPPAITPPPISFPSGGTAPTTDRSDPSK
jgi:hypothetical protein